MGRDKLVPPLGQSRIGVRSGFRVVSWAEVNFRLTNWRARFDWERTRRRGRCRNRRKHRAALRR
jgi:hypothetical protein